MTNAGQHLHDQEGVIKFQPLFQKGMQTFSWQYRCLEEARFRLRYLNLIGCDHDGIGYGNLSIRLGRADINSAVFLITGTQTGHKIRLGPEDYSMVTAFNVEENSLTCAGGALASSEAMTHAVIYQANQAVQAVIHIHNRLLFNHPPEKSESTARHIAYGTVEMADAVRKLANAANLPGCIVMQGHEDGVIFYAQSLEECSRFLHSAWFAIRRD